MRGSIPTAMAAVLAAGWPALDAEAGGDKGRSGRGRGRETMHHLESTPENTNLGGFIIDAPPVLTIESGDKVLVDVISQSGVTNATYSPVEYFGAFGVSPGEVLPDAMDFWNSLPTRTRYGPHILTGPIYVDGAEPGDTIEIEYLKMDQRVRYGLNNTSPTGGVLSTTYPGYRDGDVPLDIPPVPPGSPAGVYPDVRQHLYRTAKVRGQEVALFSDEVQVPLRPFFGVVGVAPPTGQFIGNTEDSPPFETGVQSSTQPWNFGGNMDNHLLREGTKLYLPVFQSGGQIYFGDSHSVQGDGEVSGTAIEHSLYGIAKITLHKNTGQEWPWAENDDVYIIMGFDWDLDRAMRNATIETIKFLTEEKGLTEAKAFSLASIGIDFVNSEVVDRTQVVSALIPKKYFLKKWYEKKSYEKK
ncbi:MAG: acetamidase/formamidase family protein [Myxococcota bacterium]